MKNSLLNTFFVVVLCLSLGGAFLSLSPCYSMEASEIDQKAVPPMKFKLGFEFQEGSGLCPWALNQQNIQKKALFYFKGQAEKVPLWHVVIDTSDIEFVTRPFSYKERSLLTNCISTIIGSFNILENLLKIHSEVTFSNWISDVNARFSNSLYETENFDSIRQAPIKRPSDEWEPRFSPQATIQHPLEYSIPLYFGLFGFKDSPTMLPFVASLPFRDLYLQCHEYGNSENFGKLLNGYRKKISGLVFLHALTLVQMTPDEDSSDADFLKETLQMQTSFQQVDAKVRLTLMSRRPFSSMLAAIPGFIPDNYLEFFWNAMGRNAQFMNFYEVPSLFHKANYAEQYFQEETGAEKSLVDLLPCFTNEFVEENRDVLTALLQKGIISTAMLRNLKAENDMGSFLALVRSPQNYFERIVKSIALPKERYILDLDSSNIKTIGFEFDDLSPPLFLSLENSMGAYKNELFAKEKKYGEAIIEVRGIRNVEGWFLQKTGLDPKTRGVFLTRTKEYTTEEALKLFDFLSEFGTLQYFNDIILGMTHAVYKY